MSKIDFNRLHPSWAKAFFDMWELLPEEDGVEYHHYRISATFLNDKGEVEQQSFLAAHGEGIWEWTDKEELFADFDRLREWQVKHSEELTVLKH